MIKQTKNLIFILSLITCASGYSMEEQSNGPNKRTRTITRTISDIDAVPCDLQLPNELKEHIFFIAITKKFKKIIDSFDISTDFDLIKEIKKFQDHDKTGTLRAQHRPKAYNCNELTLIKAFNACNKFIKPFIRTALDFTDHERIKIICGRTFTNLLIDKIKVLETEQKVELVQMLSTVTHTLVYQLKSIIHLLDCKKIGSYCCYNSYTCLNIAKKNIYKKVTLLKLKQDLIIKKEQLTLIFRLLIQLAKDSEVDANNFMEVFNSFLLRNYEINWKSENLLKIYDASKELLELLIKNGFNVNNDRLLEKAVFGNNIELVEILLKAGANPNVYEDLNVGHTLLFAALRDKKSDQIIKLLIEHGADVNMQTADGQTPLIYALEEYNNDIDIAKMLVEHGADINLTMGCNQTSLMAAVEGCDVDVVKWLIELGAKVNEQIIGNNNYNDYYEEIQIGSSIVKIGDTALHIAVKRRDLEIIKALTSTSNLNFELKNCLGETALCVAIRNGYINIIQELAKAGANVNATNQSGDTLMHVAVKLGNIELIKALLHGKVDLNLTNNDNKTAYDISLDKEKEDQALYEEISEMLFTALFFSQN